MFESQSVKFLWRARRCYHKYLHTLKLYSILLCLFFRQLLPGNDIRLPQIWLFSTRGHLGRWLCRYVVHYHDSVVSSRLRTCQVTCQSNVCMLSPSVFVTPSTVANPGYCRPPGRPRKYTLFKLNHFYRNSVSSRQYPSYPSLEILDVNWVCTIPSLLGIKRFGYDHNAEAWLGEFWALLY